MPDPIAMTKATGLALLIAAGVLGLLAGWGRRRPSGTTRADAGWVAGIGLGSYLGCGMLEIVPRWPIREDLDRLLGLVLPAVLAVELLGAFPRVPRWLAWTLRIAVAGLGARVLLHGSTYLAGPPSSAWTAPQEGSILAAIAAAEVVAWVLLTRLARRPAGASLPIALGVAIGAASVTIMLSAYLAGGQAGLPISAAVLGAGLASMAIPDAPRSIAPVGIAVVGLGALLVIGRFFGELRTDHAVLLFIAPLLAWLPEMPRLRRLPSWARGLLRVLLVGLAVSGVLADAARRFLNKTGPTAPAAGEYPIGDDMDPGRRASHREPLTSVAGRPMLNNDSTLFLAGCRVMGRSMCSTRWRWIPSALIATIATIGPAARAGDPTSGGDRPDPAEEEFFEAKVRPVLADHCLECHGAEKSKGGLRLDARASMLRGGDGGPAVVPGKPEESSLVEAIRYDGDVQMPPKGKLKDAEIAALTDWVRRGAHWPSPRPGAAPVPSASDRSASAAPAISEQARSFWSFRPIGDPAPPTVRDASWPTSSIDRFILARLESEGLSPSPSADRSALIRRATFDLIGLPPTPEEVSAFARDDSPDAYERLVDRLLASPHYGERWGRYWLDVARYGEDQAHSFQPRLYPQGYRYRDWVIAAFNRDMPYDRFVMQQVAGDLLDGPESDRPDRLSALGLFACGPVYYGDAKKLDQYDDRIDTMCRGFLGLTVACARCHDHKYDPIPTADYYALQGVFASTEYVEVPAAPREQVEAYDRAQAAIKAKEKAITAFLQAEAKRLDKKVPTNQLKAFERTLTGDAKKTVKAMRAEVEGLTKKAPQKYPVIHALADASTPTDMPVLARGSASSPGARVPRRFLGVLGGDRGTFRQGSGRLELARAIASPDNPLTARVMVNRIWQHHFGRGLVGTASNFGALGERPSHPELLDWLARRFIASGWSIKALHREILLSATYRQDSVSNSPGLARDPANVLLWRQNRRRLDVEAWRDAMLAVAGRLDDSLGGPPVGLDAPDNRRRTAYAAVSRHDLAWMLRLFDFPDPNITSGGRVETTVPLQQLFVLNGELMATSARAIAARLHRPDEAAPDDPARIRRAYRLLYGREATPREVDIGLAYLHAGDRPEPTGPARPDLSRWERYAQALLAANEFLFVD